MGPQKAPQGLAPAFGRPERIGQPLVLGPTIAPARRLDPDLAIQHHVLDRQRRGGIADAQRETQGRDRGVRLDGDPVDREIEVEPWPAARSAPAELPHRRPRPSQPREILLDIVPHRAAARQPAPMGADQPGQRKAAVDRRPVIFANSLVRLTSRASTSGANWFSTGLPAASSDQPSRPSADWIAPAAPG